METLGILKAKVSSRNSDFGNIPPRAGVDTSILKQARIFILIGLAVSDASAVAGTLVNTPSP